MDQKVITDNIEIILFVTGGLTASMFLQFVFPAQFTKIIYGEAISERTGILVARHWGLIVFCFGILLIYSAFNIEIRLAAMTLACMEKAGYAACVFGTSLRKRPLASTIAAADSVIVLIFCIYLLNHQAQPVT
jgi:hypothetical protein